MKEKQSDLVSDYQFPNVQKVLKLNLKIKSLQLTTWQVYNLAMLEVQLHKEGRGGDAYILRQILDKICSNWRELLQQ